MIAFIIVAILILIAFLIITTIGEADLTLLFWEKFGKPLDSLQGQVIWVTGASSGIGKALSYVLAENKAKLVLSGRNENALQEVKQHCLEISKLMKEDILVVPFDIADFAAHRGAFSRVLSYFGQLDILVNNAGRSQRASFEDIDIDVHEEMFRTNAFGPVNLTKIVLPYFLEKKKGHIVVTSSSAGLIGAPFSASYTGAKHALHGFFECLRVERASDNINVTLVCPGPVESNIVINAATGKIGETFQNPGIDPASRKCVSGSRCADLMASAIVNKLDQVWIANQPILLVHYLAQYTPSFFRNVVVMKLFTKERIKKLRDGK